jgi:hypothetical protein
MATFTFVMCITAENSTINDGDLRREQEKWWRVAGMYLYMAAVFAVYYWQCVEHHSE